MLRSFLRHNKYVYSLALPMLRSDSVEKPELMPGEIGFTRIKRLFQTQQDGQLAPELLSIMSTTTTGAFVGLLLGGLTSTANVPRQFVEENQGTKFYGQMDARQQLQQRVILRFLQGGLRTGGKLGAFCLVFASVTTFSGVYQGKVRVRNYIFGGLVTGMLFKMNMGLRAMISGGLVGCSFGALCGSICVLMLYISKAEVDLVQKTQAQWVNLRKRVYQTKTKSLNSDADIEKVHEENKQLFQILGMDAPNEGKTAKEESAETQEKK